MEIQRVPIETIVVKDKIQQRVNLNDEYVEDLVVEIANGAKLPPLIVFKHGDELLLTDGFHRFNAFLLAEIDTVEVEIYEGTERDAILHAVGANASHGLRRTNADKRLAVNTLLKDKEWGNWSDGEIARVCRVSQPFVSKVRNELTQNGFESNPMRKGSDGRTLNTSNIGVRPQAEESEDPQTSEESVSPQSEEETTTTDEENQTETPEEDNAGIEAGSDSDESVGVTASINNDETGADDESSDQSEEDNIGPDGDNVDGADESTPAASDEEESIPGSNPEELAAQVEDEDSEHDSADDSSSQEATEDAGEDNNPVESEADDSQVPSTEAPETDEVQTLRVKIIELEKVIIEKDDRITELETINTELQARIKELEAQQEVPEEPQRDTIEKIESAENLPN